MSCWGLSGSEICAALLLHRPLRIGFRRLIQVAQDDPVGELACIEHPRLLSCKEVLSCTQVDLWHGKFVRRR